MKRSRFTEEQVVRILAEGDQGEKTVTEICREQGISTATLQLAPAVSRHGRGRGTGVPQAQAGECAA